MQSCKRFLADEAGAVTVDWVVLTSVIVLLAALVVPLFHDRLVTLANDIGNAIAGYAVFME